MEYLDVTGGGNQTGQGLVACFRYKLIGVSTLLKQRVDEQIYVGINVPGGHLIAVYLDGQARLLRNLRPQRLNQLDNLFEDFFDQSTFRLQNIFVEQRASFEHVAGFELLAPVAAFELVYALFEVHIRVLERLVRGLVVSRVGVVSHSSVMRSTLLFGDS